MPQLRSLVLIGDPELLDELDLSESMGVEVYAIDLPGPLDYFQKTVEERYIGSPINQSMIDALKQEIVLYYRGYYHPVVAVYVPEQDVSDGVLQLIVIEGKLGKISSKGCRWFRSGVTEKQIGIYPGDPICSNRLLTDLAWINRNPFRCVDAVFTPGEDPSTTDIELINNDRFPLQFYAGGDNTGNDVTGNARWFAGATWGNAFWMNDIFTYQYTMGTSAHRFQSHTFHYTMPFRWQHQLRAFGGFAVVHPHMIDFHSKGTSSQASLRYTVPIIQPYCGSLHEFTIGFDFKNTNNNLIFLGEEQVPVITNTVNLTQFVVGYEYAMEDERKKLLFAAEVFYSPGKLVPNESNRLYNELNPHAKVKYVYGDLTLATTWYFAHRFALFLQGRAQLSSEVLLQSEQFGLGGYDTVRGYPEREFNADDALCLNLELRTRPVSLLRYLGACKKTDAFVFLLFFDYGLGYLINNKNDFPLANANPKIAQNQYLMGAGPGVRYTIGRYLSLRADWGVRLHHLPEGDGSRSMFHLGLVVTY